MKPSSNIAPPTGKLGVLLPGLGAVATTFVAGCRLVCRGLAKPVGSLTQLGTLRLVKRGEPVPTLVRDFVPLAGVEQLAFGAWDPFPDDAFEAARHAGVLEHHHLNAVREDLSAIKPMAAAFYPEYVRRLNGTHVKHAANKAEMVEQLRADIRDFRRDSGAERAVAIWCGSTERFVEPCAVHSSIDAFERGLRENHPGIASSQLYAWACVQEGVPFANGAPNLTVDIPAVEQLAALRGVPLAGKDFKTGQTLLKTILAPGLKARSLGLNGWFSTNILGNRDGQVLDHPDNFRTKEVSKLGVLEQILEPEQYPDLYGEMHHKVRIEYYPPRGDAKEGWDNIDLFGWLGYPMQLKVNFLCRDSILAAPLVLDLVLLLDLAQRAGLSGMQEWLGFYFKSPMAAAGVYPEHDLFAQSRNLENTLRGLMGEAAVGQLESVYHR